MTGSRNIAAVVIGRNEGERLTACIGSLDGIFRTVVYVDSGSTDGSVAWAQNRGLTVIELDPKIPFSAARARNEGFEKVNNTVSDLEFIQFLDGDCTLEAGWIASAYAKMKSDTKLAVVCGRRSELNPDASIWNRLIDEEWNTPIGQASSCGGDALIRSQALVDTGGYKADMIAGEEPEMCFRMRQLGWKIARIDAPMTVHDANIFHFSQWWQRNRRSGHAFVEGAVLHGMESNEKYNVREVARAILWGGIIPLFLAIGALVISPWALGLLLVYPAQVIRLHLLKGMNWSTAFFFTLGKFPEFQGILDFAWSQVSGKNYKIIEYK